MRSSLFTLAAAALVSGVAATPAPNPVADANTVTHTASGVEVASSAPMQNTPVVQGCFSSAGNLTFISKEQYNSAGRCGTVVCLAKGYWVAATTQGNECYCGYAYPSSEYVVDDSYCDVPCTGYGWDACGGADYYTVYNTGSQLYDIPVYGDSSSSSSSSSTSTSTSTSTSSSTTSSSTKTTTTAATTAADTGSVSTTVAGGQTIYVTQTPTATAAAETTTVEKKSSGGSSTVGIAVGTVAGVIVLAAAIGGLVFFMRRRRNKNIEDEYRRNAAVNAFFNGKPPGSSGGYSASDTRLDPVMAQRRFSDGSIADNQDYSRKILRVTNA